MLDAAGSTVASLADSVPVSAAASIAVTAGTELAATPTLALLLPWIAVTGHRLAGERGGTGQLDIADSGYATPLSVSRALETRACRRCSGSAPAQHEGKT